MGNGQANRLRFIPTERLSGAKRNVSQPGREYSHRRQRNDREKNDPVLFSEEGAHNIKEFYHRQKFQPCYTAAHMTDCEGTLHPRARQGILLMNAGSYFEAHEELEFAWKDEKGRVRELYQGILQAAVTYLHIRRGNYHGALKVYLRGMRKLKNWPDTCRGVEVGQLRKDLNAAIAEVQRLGEARLGEFDPSLFKPVIWKAGLDER